MNQIELGLNSKTKTIILNEGIIEMDYKWIEFHQKRINKQQKSNPWNSKIEYALCH